MAEPSAASRTKARSASLLGADLKPAQRARYLRIIEAAKELASEGGYDAVQMRAVAERSGVALGTVYRYFPSKNHLLVVAMVLLFEDLSNRFGDTDIPGDSAHERIMSVLHGYIGRLESDHNLYDALVRAAMFADASSSAELDRLGAIITGMYARAAGVEVVSEQLLNAVHVIADVWMSNLVSWAAGRATADQVMAHMDSVVRLVFDRLERLQAIG
ncbi:MULTISPECIES: TetR family transcriptional regulator [unclassified Rhodococcus (in: high G+C Gram-positive bacteria)]|uniref:TetR family transcriptional regulator n=1 Tax=unclassified Rhodococcus (in: high G+C Gram-positive bacteria) TaxID=192944 RepID=UPI0009264F8A|nr:TetR family transcriptional regulator [Rhodococcus sp. M8]OLL20884.1 TetR family transcriptional regulator [Rhodococcus sp. M8]QPG44731.1 TetR family transcriptional regulator [Rhodococcus sp. M8]